MGVSTDGQLCYGVMFDEDHQFPWDADEDGYLESWWHEVHGWIDGDDNPAGAWYPYTAAGEYKPEIAPKNRWDRPTDPRHREWLDKKEEWIKANVPPLPICEVNYCSAEAPMYILAVPSTFSNNRRGYPAVIDPEKDFELNEAEVNAARDFIQKYCCEDPDESFLFAWYLSSYWG